MKSEKSLSNTGSGPDRREYQREYYRRNRQRLLAYQREYTRRFKCKSRLTSHVIWQRDQFKEMINLCDLMQASPEKAARMINKVISGERSLTLS